jgi:hypothetical protein
MQTTFHRTPRPTARPRLLAPDVLRGVLTLNAATSTLGGAAAVIAGAQVAELLGTGHADRVRIAGAGLVLFSLGVLALARRPAPTRARLAPVVSVVDLVWVVATVVAIAAGWFATRGDWVMGVVGAVVLDLALAQIWAARRSAR